MEKIGTNKKLIILNDDIYRLVDDTLEMSKLGINVDTFLYFDNKTSEIQIPINLEEKVRSLNIKIIHVDTMNFYDVLNPLYMDKNNVFLFDIDLGIKMKIENNIQIVYAKYKIKNENGQDRFFFYSTYSDEKVMAKVEDIFKGKILYFDYSSEFFIPKVLPKNNKEFCEVFEI